MLKKAAFSLSFIIVLQLICYYVHVTITTFVLKQPRNIVEAKNNYNFS